MPNCKECDAHDDDMDLFVLCSMCFCYLHPFCISEDLCRDDIFHVKNKESHLKIMCKPCLGKITVAKSNNPRILSSSIFDVNYSLRGTYMVSIQDEPSCPPKHVEEEIRKQGPRCMNCINYCTLLVSPLVKDIINKVNILVSQKEFDRADKLCKSTIIENRRRVNQADLNIAHALTTLSFISFHIEGTELNDYLTEVLLIVNKTFGEHHILVGTTLGNLAIYFMGKGMHDSAEIFLNQHLICYENVYGQEHAHIVKALNDLGGFYFRLERYIPAAKCYKRSTDIYLRYLSPHDERLGIVICNLAECYEKLGKFNEAEREYKKFLDMAHQFEFKKDISDTNKPIWKIALDWQDSKTEGNPPYDTKWSNAKHVNKPLLRVVLERLANIFEIKSKKKAMDILTNCASQLPEYILRKDD